MGAIPFYIPYLPVDEIFWRVYKSHYWGGCSVSTVSSIEYFWGSLEEKWLFLEGVKKNLAISEEDIV